MRTSLLFFSPFRLSAKRENDALVSLRVVYKKKKMARALHLLGLFSSSSFRASSFYLFAVFTGSITRYRTDGQRQVMSIGLLQRSLPEWTAKEARKKKQEKSPLARSHVQIVMGTIIRSTRPAACARRGGGHHHFFLIYHQVR